MSSLQISLATVGLLVLATVVAYNLWSVRQKTSAKTGNKPGFAHLPQAQDLLRQDPPLGADAPLAAPAGASVTGDAGSPGGSLNGHIDAIARVQMMRMVSGEAALQALRGKANMARVGNKPFAIEGMNAQTRQWEALHAAQRYTEFRAGVQLVNRHGTITAHEFAEFDSAVEGFAEALNAVAHVPDMAQELARAQALDQFALDCDNSFSLTLRPQQAAWSAAWVRQNAQQLGFVAAAAPGCMVLDQTAADADAPPLLTLRYAAGAQRAEDGGPQEGGKAQEDADDGDSIVVHELELALDVTQIAPQANPLQTLQEVAEQLCRSMEAQLSIQERAPDWDVLRQHLHAVQRALDSRGLGAGSALALRLFSH